jgi:aryl-alcohol dehydrogenase-like predicted oxidoreductase
LIWSPLAGGLLSGKYTRQNQTQNNTRFAEGWTEPPIRNADRLWNIIDVLIQIAKEKQVPTAQIALAWVLTRPGISSLVIGSRTLEHIDSNINACDIKLSEDERKRLNEVSKLPLIYPYWHQLNFVKHRMSEGDKVLLKDHIG